MGAGLPPPGLQCQGVRCHQVFDVTLPSLRTILNPPHPFHSLASLWVAQGLPSILSSELSLLNSFDLGSEISPSSHSRCCFAGSVAPESEPPLPTPRSGLPWHLPWPAFLSTPWEGLRWRNPCLPGFCLGGPPACPPGGRGPHPCPCQNLHPSRLPHAWSEMRTRGNETCSSSVSCIVLGALN